MSDSEIECKPLSTDGIRSYEYVRWKEQTLANQTSHKEAQQRTGLWQKFTDVEISKKDRDENTFKIELAQGVRLVNNGGVEATWSCPSYTKLGCPTIFSARIIEDDNNNEEIEEENKNNNECASSHHCRGCKLYKREEEYVNPIIFGLFSPELWTAVKTVFCKRNDKTD